MPHIKNQYNIAFGKGASNKNCFHMYGIDILLDEDFNPWVLEINSNPSFNMNISKFVQQDGTTNFKLVNEVSEIDKYIKSMVLGDAFKILSCGLEKINKLGSFERLYPDDRRYSPRYNVLDQVREVFEALAGQREFGEITNS